jgi:DNA-binding transcriptional LysR family regulator
VVVETKSLSQAADTLQLTRLSFRQGARPPVRHSLDALVSAAIGGAGIARVPSWQVSADMSAGRIKALLTDCERPAAPVHAVFQHSKLASAKIRTFIDYLVAQWAGEAFAGTWRLKG